MNQLYAFIVLSLCFHSNVTFLSASTVKYRYVFFSWYYYFYGYFSSEIAQIKWR